MKYYDIHTHHLPSHQEDTAIINRIIGKDDRSAPEAAFLSCGIHPWYISDVEEQWKDLQLLAAAPEVVAIGEAGLDKLVSAPMNIQEEVFHRQIQLSEALQKPLIIHCVKAWPELIAIHKNVSCRMPWIIHGFRGNGELARQLLGRNFLLSFGAKFHTAALQAAWPHSFLAETDEAAADIRIVYEQMAAALSVPADLLASQLEENVGQVFCLSK